MPSASSSAAQLAPPATTRPVVRSKTATSQSPPVLPVIRAVTRPLPDLPSTRAADVEVLPMYCWKHDCCAEADALMVCVAACAGVRAPAATPSAPATTASVPLVKIGIERTYSDG